MDTNDHSPTFNQESYNFNVTEEKPSGLLVGIVSASDIDVGQNGNVTYKITSGNTNNTFEMVTNYVSIYREYVYSVAVYQKYLTRLGNDSFLALARKLPFLPTKLDIFYVQQHYEHIPIYLSTSDSLSFIISNTKRHEFSNI